jgi:hypothetical protein
VDKLDHHDRVLVRYLLGVLPEDEAQRLDELSVADDEFALRLQAAENDLVDSYARGELSGDTLEQFQSFYLNSPKRREKLAFAETMRARELKTAAAAARSPQTASVSRSGETCESSSSFSFWQFFSVPHMTLQWGFAGAAFALLFIAGYLFLENRSVQNQLVQTQSQQEALNQRQQQLQSQLNEQQSVNAEAKSEVARLRDSLAHLSGLQSAAILLMPQVRGTSQPVNISVPPDIEKLFLQLELESDEFSQYRAVLKDPATDHVVWRSATLAVNSGAKTKAVSIALPIQILKPQNYSLELRGISAKGLLELVSTYTFRVVPR